MNPTYLGFMYNNQEEDMELKYSTTERSSAYASSSTSNYVFSKKFKYDKEKTSFSLDTTNEEDYLVGRWIDLHEQIMNSETPYYTCLSTSLTGTCSKLNKIVRYTYNENNQRYYMYYNEMAYQPTSYANANKNIAKSNILINLENWYEENLKEAKDKSNNYLSEYLSDGIYCNDRSLYSGNGYTSLDSQTSYKSYSRSNRNNLLICERADDRFSLSNTIGNGKLKYPIGLITADEVSLAGGKSDASYANNKYFLYWNGNSFLTMTPYYSNLYGENIFYVYSSTYLSSISANSKINVRPVINLKANTKIVSGEGTTDSPFEITLQN